MVKLDIREIDPKSVEPHLLPRDYTFQNWWSDCSYMGDSEGHRHFVVANDGGEEVARFVINETAKRRNFISSSYPIPLDGPELMEIQFIDVRESYRGHGIGTRVVEQIADKANGRQLIALSEESDAFWESMGWRRVQPADDLRRPLYVAP